MLDCRMKEVAWANDHILNSSKVAGAIVAKKTN